MFFTVYNQSGGQGKSTITKDLGAVLADAGLDVLLIDLDAQHTSLSHYLNFNEEKRNPEADDLSLHLIDRPKGPFEDLIKEANENLHLLPSHTRLGNVDDLLDTHGEYLSSDKPSDWEYPRYKRLKTVLSNNDVYDNYDAIICDPNAKADTPYYLALYATRNVVIPAQSDDKGYESIEGVKDSAKNFAKEKNIDLGLNAVVPTMLDVHTSYDKKYARKMREDYHSPVFFKDIKAHTKAMNNSQTILEYFDHNGVSTSESQILPKYRTLALHIANTFGEPLPEGLWDESELWQGEPDIRSKKLLSGDGEFWGTVDLPFDNIRPKATETAEVN